MQTLTMTADETAAYDEACAADRPACTLPIWEQVLGRARRLHAGIVVAQVPAPF